jgi:hypothetical protein
MPPSRLIRSSRMERISAQCGEGLELVDWDKMPLFKGVQREVEASGQTSVSRFFRVFFHEVLNVLLRDRRFLRFGRCLIQEIQGALTQERRLIHSIFLNLAAALLAYCSDFVSIGFFLLLAVTFSTFGRFHLAKDRSTSVCLYSAWHIYSTFLAL